MGKRIIAQKRGKGSLTYRAPSHRWRADVSYEVLKAGETKTGTVVKIRHDPGRNAPLALVEFPGRKLKKRWFIVPEGVSVGDVIQIGEGVEVKPGNVLPLANIPEGTPIFNIEALPDDGGRFARSSGAAAVTIARTRNKATIMLPSKRMIELDARCRATVGVPAGGERKIKPLVKAGTHYWQAKARGKLFPRTSAGAMNVVAHKFGGSHLGIAKTAGRHAPPGRKVGSIAAKKTGRKKR